jgi:hypothetical protein
MGAEFTIDLDAWRELAGDAIDDLPLEPVGQDLDWLVTESHGAIVAPPPYVLIVHNLDDQETAGVDVAVWNQEHPLWPLVSSGFCDANHFGADPLVALERVVDQANALLPFIRRWEGMSG